MNLWRRSNGLGEKTEKRTAFGSKTGRMKENQLEGPSPVATNRRFCEDVTYHLVLLLPLSLEYPWTSVVNRRLNLDDKEWLSLFLHWHLVGYQHGPSTWDSVQVWMDSGFSAVHSRDKRFPGYYVGVVQHMLLWLGHFVERKYQNVAEMPELKFPTSLFSFIDH